MTTHLKLEVLSNEHPKETMKRLGITYQHATPQSIADQWWFWNCQNIPDPLPQHFSILLANPLEYINFGLSTEKALDIFNFEKMQRPSPKDYIPTDFIRGKYEDDLQDYCTYLEDRFIKLENLVSKELITKEWNHSESKDEKDSLFQVSWPKLTINH